MPIFHSILTLQRRLRELNAMRWTSRDLDGREVFFDMDEVIDEINQAERRLAALQRGVGR